MMMALHRLWAAPLALALLLTACTGDDPDFAKERASLVSRVVTPTVTKKGPDGKPVVHQRPYLMDARGRYVQVNGVNLAGSSKFPVNEVFPDTTTPPIYLGKPFPLAQADAEFARLRGLGFNTLRLITSWEALEPNEPGVYDGEYLKYLEAIVQKAADYGLYVLLDMHQDIFSRHLLAKYNSKASGESGSLERSVLSLLPPYDNWVRGDGAPRWVVQACLPEKNLDSPHWGELRVLGSLEPKVVEAVFKNIDLLDLPNGELAILAELAKILDPANGITLGLVTENLQILLRLKELLELVSPGGTGDLPDWVKEAATRLPGRFDLTETCDFLPTTFWGVNAAISLDLDRCFLALYAGREVFPDLLVDGVNIEEYLQAHLTEAWRLVAARMKGHDNVIGYDLFNEPVGFFPAALVASVLISTGAPDAAEGLLKAALGDSTGALVYRLAVDLQVIPPDGSPETLKKWGLAGMNPLPVLDLNLSFDGKYLMPLYQRLATAIQNEDSDAIIFLEPGMSLKTVTGNLPQWNSHLVKPEGIRQAVLAPHWYPDIYPVIGINVDPRDFQVDEWLYRDFVPEIQKVLATNAQTTGNIPVVFGEFGTYFNFNGIAEAQADDYAISAAILNRYYEAFEELGLGRILWCYSPDNTAENGDGWNREDFSILGPDRKPRAWQAFLRPHARATSGRLISQRFHGPLAFLDPAPGEALEDRLFELTMETRQTAAPTAVFVPTLQYPEGFFVWLSDGAAYYDRETQLLFWYPTNEAPGTTHSLRLRPRATQQDWDYFFDGPRSASGGDL